MTIETATASWLASMPHAAPATLRKFRIVARLLASHFGGKAIDRITPTDMTAYRATRKVKGSTWRTELVLIKAFFKYCAENGLITGQPAAKLKPPRAKTAEKRPYTQEEVIAILAAADLLPASAYVKLRVKAAIVVMWQHGLRVSDAIGLRRDALVQVNGRWRLRLRTQKTGAAIDHIVPSVVLDALGNLPVPVRASKHEHFFWSGRGSVGSTQANMEKKLHEVYTLSGVLGAHNHRFRHTFASSLLAKGCDSEKIAYLMGISYVVAMKTYAHLTREFQESADAMMAQVGQPQDYRESHRTQLDA